MEYICHDGTQYVLFEEIMGKMPMNKKEFALRDMRLHENEYIYVSKNKSGYKVLDKASRYKAKKLCISKECINQHQDVIKQYLKPPTPTILPVAIDDNYLSNVKKDQISVREKKHHIYIVSSPHVLLVKVGIWCNCLSILASRYKMYYGSNIRLLIFHVNSSLEKEKIEKDFMCHFRQERVSGELFDKKAYDEYITFLQKITASDGFVWDKDGTINAKPPRPIFKLPLLPAVVELDNKEMFHFDGTSYNIKIRGTRFFETTFFCMSDVGKLFDMKRINTILINYHRGVDYVTFKNKDVHGHADNMSSNNVVNYFTTQGLYKFVGRIKNRSAIHEAFPLWLSRILTKC